MKTACYILAVYFLSLLVVPCADDIADSPQNDIPAFSISDTGDSHDHTDSGDDCSSMCACHCCHVHVMIVPVGRLGLAGNSSASHVEHLQQLTTTVVSPFLRPPIA